MPHILVGSSKKNWLLQLLGASITSNNMQIASNVGFQLLLNENHQQNTIEVFPTDPRALVLDMDRLHSRELCDLFTQSSKLQLAPIPTDPVSHGLHPRNGPPRGLPAKVSTRAVPRVMR